MPLAFNISGGGGRPKIIPPVSKSHPSPHLRLKPSQEPGTLTRILAAFNLPGAKLERTWQRLVTWKQEVLYWKLAGKIAIPLQWLHDVTEVLTSLTRGSGRVVLGTVAASPGSLLEMQIHGPTPDRLNQKLWEWGPAICVLTSTTGDYDVL